MDKSGQKRTEKIAEPGAAQQQDLDAVFSSFFEKVEELKPVNKPRSAKDYLQANRDKIIHALSKGYTYEDLAELLKECGFSISASTLRRYIGGIKGKKGDALTPELSQSPTTDLAPLEQLPNSTSATNTDTEKYQPQLRPRRK